MADNKVDIGQGVQLEWAIVYFSLVESGMRPDVVKKRHPKLRPYAGIIENQAKQAVALVKKVMPDILKTAQHSDEVRPPIVGNPEPKTDVVYKGVRASVKMLGPIQLASGEGVSTSKMFCRVMEEVDVKNSKSLMGLIHDIETLPTKMVSVQNIDRLKKEKPELLKSFLDAKGKVKHDKDYQYWLAHNKAPLLAHILDFLDKNPEFHKALVREALTGELVFGEKNPATATHILTPKTFNKIDDRYVSHMLAKTHIDIRAKARGGVTSIAFRFDVRT